MNIVLQHKFEKQMLESCIISDRNCFNKDSKGIYEYVEVFNMYRVWVNQEAKYELKVAELKRKVEESFMCGYTEAEYDFRKRFVNE